MRTPTTYIPFLAPAILSPKSWQSLESLEATNQGRRYGSEKTQSFCAVDNRLDCLFHPCVLPTGKSSRRVAFHRSAFHLLLNPPLKHVKPFVRVIPPH